MIQGMQKKCLSSNSESFAELCVDLLNRGKSVRFMAHGSSMKPMVRDGDILLVEPALINSARLGMVVLCLASPGRVVVHRIIKIKRDQKAFKYLIQGDNVEKPDGWFTAKEIIGNIKSIQRDGTVVDLHSPTAKSLAVLVALKVRTPLSRRARVLSYLYSRIKRLPIFKVFFS